MATNGTDGVADADREFGDPAPLTAAAPSEDDGAAAAGDHETEENLRRWRLRAQSREVVGWALDRATGWGPVLEVAGAVRQVAEWVRPSGPSRIDGYRSYGGANHVRVRGRVLAGRSPGSAQEGERQIRAAGRMATRFLSTEVADVTVEVCYDGVTRRAESNDEGYFVADFTFERPPTSGVRWSMAQARVLDDESGAGQWWPIEVMVVGQDVERIIVSDVDDTILINGVGAAARTVLTTISGSELTREAVPGAAELYQELCRPTGAGADSPIFYVSSSPWNLYDFLVAFLEVNRFPPGPLLLRDIGLSRQSFSDDAHRDHKVETISDILARLPEPQVVLIGDSSLQDAHAFTAIIERHPGRVAAAFLRDVGDHERTDRAMAVLAEQSVEPAVVLATDMADIARHLR